MSLALKTTRYCALATRSSHDVSHSELLAIDAAFISSASKARAAAATPMRATNSRRLVMRLPPQRGGSRRLRMQRQFLHSPVQDFRHVELVLGRAGDLVN